MTLTGTLLPAISKLTEENQQRVHRLLAHTPPSINLQKYPPTRQAAVLVLLFERAGELRVLLTTRAKTLRTHPGQTALPGGAKDDSDATIVDAAYREAMEEVGLPLHHPDVHTLCLLRPFIAWTRSFVLVTPVVALLTDLSVLETLTPSPDEVDLIFDHPLAAILEPSLGKGEPLVPLNSELWPSSDPFYNYADSKWAWMGNSTYRLHRFRAAAAAIKGMTADVLILAAAIAFEREPSFEWYAPGQFAGLEGTLAALDITAFNSWNRREPVKAEDGSVVVRPVSLE
ncbi:NUDIX hydrolase domain-like protein [Phanerochaete sordida]|uniref:NUDIX hydrolase domain-like protein n=1 Tax=Phanerochaete sordida TaxID=48140 RepID=A0A9P3GH90_9APHY|nr:NUDIX hydrolase domain-like protein [Phanerochaete sordida]